MSEHTRETVCSRRTLLKAGTGAAAITVTGTAAAQSGENYDGYLSDVNNYDGTTTDLTGQSDVTINVGAGNGLLFGPAAVQVDTGTTVTWEWTGQGGGHNVVAEDGSFTSGDTVAEAGTTYEQTFDSEDVVKYYCDPHKAAGMKGVVAVGDTAQGEVAPPADSGDGGDGSSDGGDGSDTPQPDFGGYLEDANNYDGTLTDARGEGNVVVDVGAGNGLAFGPAAVHVDNGTTVTWEWTGNGGAHNVIAEDETFDSGELVSEQGTTFEYTFEEDGIYNYFCDPHKASGMVASVVVGEEYPTTGGGDGGDGGSGGGDGGGGGNEGSSSSANDLALQTLAAMLVLGLLSPILFLLIARRKMGGTTPRP
jgi:halocyanin-like protein